MSFLFRKAKILFSDDIPPRLALFFFVIIINFGAGVIDWLSSTPRPLWGAASLLVLRLLSLGLLLLLAFPAADAFLRPIAPRLIRWGRWAALLCLLYSLGQGAVTLTGLVRSYIYTDRLALAHNAAEEVLEGRNPYSNTNIVEVAREFHLSPQSLTPLKEGDFSQERLPPPPQAKEQVFQRSAEGEDPPEEFESKVSYPAGSFLFHIPAVALGVKDLRWFYFLLAVAFYFIFWWRAPGRFKPFVLLVAAANGELWLAIQGATIDMLFTFFLFCGWLSRRRPLVSSLFLGLAAASKQTSWFFLPFFFLYFLREEGWKGAGRRGLVLVGTFLALNLPFIVANPRAWGDSILAPMLDPMFPEGVGLVALVHAGLLNYWNSFTFAGLETIALGAGLAWFYLRGWKTPRLAFLLPAFPLFFAWRSLPSYFTPFPLLLLAVVVLEEYGQKSPLPSQEGKGW